MSVKKVVKKAIEIKNVETKRVNKCFLGLNSPKKPNCIKK